MDNSLFRWAIPDLPELTIDDFLAEYKRKWINYCEIIILKNGNIILANPSHTERMLKLTGEDRNDIYERMPIVASPIHWLVDYTKNISVWHQFQILPEDVTEEQLKTLSLLESEKMIKKNYNYVTNADIGIFE
jgi:hypothetical protein